MNTFPHVEREKRVKNDIPVWHRRAQKAYHVNRIIILLQIVAAFVLCGVIWVGVERVLH